MLDLSWCYSLKLQKCRTISAFRDGDGTYWSSIARPAVAVQELSCWRKIQRPAIEWQAKIRCASTASRKVSDLFDVWRYQAALYAGRGCQIGPLRNSNKVWTTCELEISARKTESRRQDGYGATATNIIVCNQCCSWTSNGGTRLGIYRRFKRRLCLKAHLADLQIDNL